MRNAAASMTRKNETYHETSFPTMSAPGSNHRNMILRRVPRSIHVPSEARCDEEDVSEEFVSGLEVTLSAGKET